jgi:hypothetical protein
MYPSRLVKTVELASRWQYKPGSTDGQYEQLRVRARMYGPHSRWQVPAGRSSEYEWIRCVLGWDRYAYAGSNPASRRDPAGLKAAALDPGQSAL